MILIYSETDAAKAKRDELRAGGAKAALRNPQYFKVEEIEPAALVIADDPAILSAYLAKGVKAEHLTAITGTGRGVALPPADNTEKTFEPEEGTEDLKSLTVAQLRDLAAEKGINLKAGLTKAAIIEAIQSNETE